MQVRSKLTSVAQRDTLPPELPQGFTALPMTDAYIRLISGSCAATGLEDDCASRYMAEHMRRLADLGGEHAQAFATAARELRFCTDIERELQKAQKDACADGFFKEMLGKMACTRTLKGAARRVLQSLGRQEATLVPASYLRVLQLDAHMMYVLFTKERDGDGTELGSYTAQLFNTGGTLGDADWQRYHVKSAQNGKWQTVATFRGLTVGKDAGELNEASLVELFRFAIANLDVLQSSDLCVYRWLQRHGTFFQDMALPGHAKQKVGSCTHKGLMAYLAYTLPPAAYHEAKALLLEDAVYQLAARTGAIDSLALPALVLRKAQAARSKANGIGSTKMIVEHPQPAEDSEEPRRLLDDDETPVGGDEPASLAHTHGSASVQPGSDHLDTHKVSLNQAVYFPDTEGKYYFVVLGNEAELARNLWRNIQPEGSFHRLYMRVPQDTKVGKMGFYVHRDEEDSPFKGQSACMHSSVKARMVFTDTGPCLEGDFQGESSILTGSGEFWQKRPRVKGTFNAELLDMSHRQMVRPHVASYCAGWDFD